VAAFESSDGQCKARGNVGRSVDMVAAEEEVLRLGWPSNHITAPLGELGVRLFMEIESADISFTNL